MKILLWAPFGAGSHYHGAGMAACGLSAGLRQAGFRVDVAHGVLGHNLMPAAFDSQALVSPLDATKLSQVRFLWSARQWLGRNVRDYDVVFGITGFQVTVSPLLWAEASGVPAVLKVANATSDLGPKPGLRNWIGVYRRRQASLSKLSAVVALSEEIQTELVNYGVSEDRIFKIPNGVDISRFKPAVSKVEKSRLRQGLGLPESPLVLFVGEIVPRKRPHLLLSALNHVPEAKAVFLGPTPDAGYQAELQRQVRQQSLAERVIWRDFTSKVEDYFRASDLFCLPSENEGMSNALLEAQSCGLPAVCTATSGMAEVLCAEDSGYIVDPTPEAIGTALKALLRSDAIRAIMGAAARGRIERHFSSNAVTQRYISLFSETAGPTG